MKIIFLTGEQPKIDRGWDITSVCKTLIEYNIDYYIIDIQSFLNGNFEINSQKDIIWPCTYQCSADLSSASIFNILENLQYRYIGPSFLSSFLNDKFYLKNWLTKNKINTPAFFFIPQIQKTIPSSYQGLRDVVILKPRYSATSAGIITTNFKKTNIEILSNKIHTKYKQDVLIEQWIEAREFTTAFIKTSKNTYKTASLEIKFNPQQKLFDKKMKTDYEGVSFSSLSIGKEKSINSISQEVLTLMPFSSYGRIDILENSAGELFIIDVNFFPGMDDSKSTPSLFPLAFKKKYNWSFSELVMHTIESHRFR